MLEEINRATAEKQAAVFSEAYNAGSAVVYDEALRQWLHDTQIRQAAGLPTAVMPTPGRKVEYYLDPAPSTVVRMRFLSQPVSSLTLADIMPKYGTDINAVGGPVGGPIPNRPGDFYAASDAKPQPGDTHATPDGGLYVYKAQGFAGLERFWRKLA